MSDEKRAPITVIGDLAKPSETPVSGERRIVPYLPVGLPGMKGRLFPCIWQSPYSVFDSDLREQVKICIMLITEGPPKPDIMAIRIPAEAITKFPTGPVNW